MKEQAAMRDIGQDGSTWRFQNLCPFWVYSARSGCMMSIVPLLCALMCPTASRSDLRIWFHRRKHPCRDSETIWLFRNCPWFWLAEPVRALVPFRCPLIPLAQLTSKIQFCAINGTNFFLIHSLCTLWGRELYGKDAFSEHIEERSARHPGTSFLNSSKINVSGRYQKKGTAWSMVVVRVCLWRKNEWKSFSQPLFPNSSGVKLSERSSQEHKTAQKLFSLSWSHSSSWPRPHTSIAVFYCQCVEWFFSGLYKMTVSFFLTHGNVCCKSDAEMI